MVTGYFLCAFLGDGILIADDRMFDFNGKL